MTRRNGVDELTLLYRLLHDGSDRAGIDTAVIVCPRDALETLVLEEIRAHLSRADARDRDTIVLHFVAKGF